METSPHEPALAHRATLTASATAFILILLKLSVVLITGSVAILASALDSLLDMGISLFNTYAVKTSQKPEDVSFNYGRGKLEAIAASLEGIILLITCGFILQQAWFSLSSTPDFSSRDIFLNLGVLAVSTVITFFLVMYLRKVAKQTQNLVIQADCLHYKTDLYTNIALFAGMLVIGQTGWYWVDSVLGMAVAVFLGTEAIKIIRSGFLILMDQALDATVVDQIKQVIAEFAPRVSSLHHFRSRQSGSSYFVEFHLVFNENMLLKTAHDTSDEVSKRIRKLDPQKKWYISIHLDPVDDSGTTFF
jgi:ferrous-iron efflux pump FieF